MISRRILASVLGLCTLAAPAYAQKTKAQINTEIGILYPDNTTGAITPLALRTVAADTINAIMPPSPVVAGNLACFNGTTGLLKDCAVAPSGVGITIGSTPVNGGGSLNVLAISSGLLAQYPISGSGSVCLTVSCAMTTPNIGVATATSVNGLNVATNGGSGMVGLSTSSVFGSASGAGDDVAIGANAGQNITSGNQNVVIGSSTGNALTVDSGNTLIGYNVAPTLHNAIIPNNFNTAIGNQALRQCTSCGSNVAMGRAAMLAETTGDHNTAVGHATLFTGVANIQTTAIGDSAGGAALAGTAIPAGFPNVGVNVFPFNGDTNLECIGETCGKTTSAVRKQSFAIGSYSRIPAQDNSAWLGNGLSVAGTSGKLWTGSTSINVSSAVGVTLTAAQVLSGFIDRTGAAGAGFTDTLPTAQQIVQSTSGGPGNGCEVPISRQFTYGNRGTGQTATLTTNTGLTLATTTGVLTVLNNTGSTWQMIITNCASGTEAITVFRTQ